MIMVSHYIIKYINDNIIEMIPKVLQEKIQKCPTFDWKYENGYNKVTLEAEDSKEISRSQLTTQCQITDKHQCTKHNIDILKIKQLEPHIFLFIAILFKVAESCLKDIP